MRKRMFVVPVLAGTIGATCYTPAIARDDHRETCPQQERDERAALVAFSAAAIALLVASEANQA